MKNNFIRVGVKLQNIGWQIGTDIIKLAPSKMLLYKKKKMQLLW